MTRRARTILLVLVAAVVWFAAADAEAEGRRVALVIGNGAYEHQPALPNPRNDADDIAAAFERLGFAVTRAHDLGFSEMRATLHRFRREATGAEVAIVFFAGHGMEVNGRNYLIPTDAELATDLDISYEAFPVELVNEAVSSASGLSLVILDACRNNPFAASMRMLTPTRSVGRGLARMEPISGSLVAFAAKEGTTAEDGTGRNSPYTAALLAYLERPGLEINFLFRKVRDRVLAATGNRQEPFVYGSLPGEAIYLKPADGAGRGGATAPGATAAEAWSIVATSDDPVLIAAFRQQFGPANPFYDRLAARRLEELARPDASEAPPASGADVAIAALAPAPGREPRTRAARREECDRLAAHTWDPSARAPGVSWSRLSTHAEDAIAACRGALLAFPDDVTVRFQLARALDASGDHLTALRMYRAAAEEGYSIALSNVAGMYHQARGVERNDAEAYALWREAAALGNVAAMEKLGDMYRCGCHVEEDLEKAAEWYRKAAEGGDPDADVELGHLYRDGRGVPRDRAKAVALYRRAAERGHAQGQADLGFMLSRGFGVEQDYGEAIRWYRKAIAQGNALAINNMGYLYEMGHGVERDQAEALRLYRQAAEKGNGLARTNLGLMYYNGRGTERDYAEAARWYRLAAESGHARGRYLLADMYACGCHFEKDLERAAALYREAAEEGSDAARRALARLLDRGTGIPRDHEEAARLMLAAARGGDGTAREALRSGARDFSRAFRRAVQRELQTAGHYGGALDGAIGPKSRAALDAYLSR